MKKIGQFFKKHWKKFLLAIIIIAIIAGIIYLSFRAYDRYQKNLLTDPGFKHLQNIKAVETIGKSLFSCQISIFSLAYNARTMV